MRYHRCVLTEPPLVRRGVSLIFEQSNMTLTNSLWYEGSFSHWVPSDLSGLCRIPSFLVGAIVDCLYSIIRFNYLHQVHLAFCYITNVPCNTLGERSLATQLEQWVRQGESGRERGSVCVKWGSDMDSGGSAVREAKYWRVRSTLHPLPLTAVEIPLQANAAFTAYALQSKSFLWVTTACLTGLAFPWGVPVGCAFAVGRDLGAVTMGTVSRCRVIIPRGVMPSCAGKFPRLVVPNSYDYSASIFAVGVRPACGIQLVATVTYALDIQIRSCRILQPQYCKGQKSLWHWPCIWSHSRPHRAMWGEGRIIAKTDRGICCQGHQYGTWILRERGRKETRYQALRILRSLKFKGIISRLCESSVWSILVELVASFYFLIQCPFSFHRILHVSSRLKRFFHMSKAIVTIWPNL